MAFEPSELIYCKRTRDRGMGVFARKRIAAGTLIEQVPVLVLPTDSLYHPTGTSPLGNYVFHWRKDHVALALGYGSLYNHSYAPNARCRDVQPKSKQFIAIRDIERDEEITFNYNGQPDDNASVGFEVI